MMRVAAMIFIATCLRVWFVSASAPLTTVEYAPHRFAVAYLLHDVKSFDRVRKSYDSFRKYFASNHDWVVFTHQKHVGRLRTIFETAQYVIVDESVWRNTSTEPELFRLPSVPTHPGFDVEYRRMGRYVAGFMLKHEALRKYELVMKIDDDVFAYAPFDRNPFHELISKNKRFGYWMFLEENRDVTMGLDALMKRSGPYTTKSIVLDDANEFKNHYFYGCVLVFDPSWFRDSIYEQMFLKFEPNFMARRWDEQKIVTWWAAKTLRPSQIECLDYIHVEHSEWARSARCVSF